ncbi:MAG: class I SAM-dependent methyltransferase [Rhodoferax sp.]|nr:class I SAM-dependent methyltransferase [Rhodoferax sp.]
MTTLFKIDLAKVLASGDAICLELGCGPNKVPGRIGIDRLDMPGVDIVTNIEDGLGFLPDASIDEIHSESFFEHVPDLEKLMSEIVRVLKPGGFNSMFVPHFSSPFYYSDYTHNRFFGLYTLRYFCADDNQLQRKVPNFYSNIRVKIVSQRMVFYSSFRGIRFVKKAFQRLVNWNEWTQEFYEENLCYLIPCYGMEFKFERA